VEEFCYVSQTNKIWECVKCKKEVSSESSISHGPGGRPVTLYTPASRYWLPAIKLFHTAGVFCSVECAQP
jgi:hypothetical protein